jgi:hypothetical protein
MAETIQGESGSIVRAVEVLENLTGKSGVGGTQLLEEAKKTRTAQETLVMLYRNAEARKERGAMFSR